MYRHGALILHAPRLTVLKASYHIKHNVQIGWKQRRDIRKSKRQAAADMTLLIALSFK